MNEKAQRIKRIDNMTRAEIDYELKQLGLYNQYKDYSLQYKKDRLIYRICNF